MERKYIKLYLIAMLLLLIVGCGKEKTEVLNEDLLENFSIKPDIDFRVTYDLSKISLEDVISKTMDELYSDDMTEDIEMRSGGSEEQQGNITFVAVDFLISDTQVTVVTVVGEDSVLGEASDDDKCGGKAGDGWKSYGTCFTKECVETKSGEAATELSNSLTPGKCLDIRVKRNTLNARVCGRVISC